MMRKGWVYIPQSFRIGALPLDVVLYSGQMCIQYLSVPPTRQDLTQGPFYYERGRLGTGQGLCWTMVVIGSLDAIGTMQAFAKSLSRKPGDLAGHSLTTPEGLVLCSILCPPESGSAGAGGHTASNLSLTWYPIWHKCQITQLRSQGRTDVCMYLHNPYTTSSTFKQSWNSVFLLLDWLLYPG